MMSESELQPQNPPSPDSADMTDAMEIPTVDVSENGSRRFADSGDIVLEMRGIGKTFPGVRALSGVNLTLRSGQVHALLGENGAGKSTLIKILSGAYRLDEGEILLDGQPIQIKSPVHAERFGISTIYQEFNLAPNRTIAENIFLGHLPKRHGLVDWVSMEKKAGELLQSLGVDLPVDTVAGKLSVAQQQMVEIAKALHRKTRVLIMDEPSAVLSEKDLDNLFDVVRKLQSRGIGIVYISHRLSEVFALADEVTVLKDGRYVDTRPVSEVSMEDLVRMMIGRDLTDVYPERNRVPGEVVLSVEGLAQERLVKNASFELRAGEIVGVAGINGSGRTEVARAIFGADRVTAGQMLLFGRRYLPRSPKEAIGRGVALVTEDRKGQGLLLKLNVAVNMTISGLKSLSTLGVLRAKSEKTLVSQWIKNLKIKTPSSDFLVANMSGGNQQKVVLARWLSLGIKVFIFDEPTRGIDVGAKQEIYQIMADLAARGTAVMLISSELPEVLGMSDRILVMREGRLVQELTGEEASEERVMQYAVGSD